MIAVLAWHGTARWSLHTQRFGTHWIGLAEPAVAMRFALREVDGTALAGATGGAGAGPGDTP
jgi:hypothetical protein